MSDESDEDDVIILPDFHVDERPNLPQEEIPMLHSRTSLPVRRNSNESSDSLEYVDAEEGASPNVVMERGGSWVPRLPRTTTAELVTRHLELVAIPRQQENEVSPPIQRAFNDNADSVLETLIAGEESHQQPDCIFADDVTPLKDYKSAINYQPSDAPTYFAKVFYVAKLENRSRASVTESLEFLKANDNGQTNMIDRMFYLLKAKTLISNGSNDVLAELIDHKTTIDSERKAEWEIREAKRQLVVASNTANFEKQITEAQNTTQDELELTQVSIEKEQALKIQNGKEVVIEDKDLLERKRKFDKMLELEAELIESSITVNISKEGKEENEKERKGEEKKLMEEPKLKFIEENKLENRRLKLKQDEGKAVRAVRVPSNLNSSLSQLQQKIPSPLSASILPPPPPPPSSESQTVQNSIQTATLPSKQSTTDPRLLRKLSQRRKREEDQLRKEQSSKIVELLRKKLPSSIVTNVKKSIDKNSSEKVTLNETDESNVQNRAYQSAPVISHSDIVQSEQPALKSTYPDFFNSDTKNLKSPPPLQASPVVDLPDPENRSPNEKIGGNEIFEEHSDGEKSLEILDIPQVICTVCSEIFTDYKSLTKHFIANH